MGLKTLFFDTYAFHEIIEGNPNYKDYIKNISIVTTKMNLLELHYGLLRKFDIKTADKYYEIFNIFALDIPDDVIIEASKFKYKHKKKKLSYVDCIGYIIALRNNIPFLTGDKEFEGLDNVEFVK